MKQFECTIIYAERGMESAAAPDFSKYYSGGKEKLELILVREDDLLFPRKASIEAIEGAKGRFILMLDQGDLLPEHFLDEAVKLMKKETAFVMPALAFQENARDTEAFFMKTEAPLTVNTAESAQIFPGDLHGILFPAADLKEMAACHKAEPEAEKRILLALLERKPVFAYMGNAVLKYKYSKESNTGHDFRASGKEWYFDPFDHFLLPLLREEKKEKGQIPLLHQCFAIFMVNIRLHANRDNQNKHLFTKEEALAYADYLCGVMKYVEISTILDAQNQCHPVMMNTQRMLLLIQMAKQDFTYRFELDTREEKAVFLCDGLVAGKLSLLPLRLMQMDYEKGRLEIDGEYADYLPEAEIKVTARFDGKDYPLQYNQRYAMSKYFGVTAFRQKTFHVSIPVKKKDQDRRLVFVLHAKGKEHVLEYAFPMPGSRFAKDFSYEYWRFDRYLAYWKKNGIHVIQATPARVLKKEVMLWLQMWKAQNGYYRDLIPLKMLNFALRPYFKKKKIWLFMDKIYKGGDSSEYIYRYARGKKDGIQKYYLLDKDSADYKRMKKAGEKPLARGSLKHRLAFLNADMVIASNSSVFAFNDYPFKRSLPIRSDVHFDVACVQHGMSVQKIAIAQQRLRDNTRLYFCASKYEIENLSKPVYDYIGYDALKLTGVPRYDGLIDQKEKILVISPTWRMQSALPFAISESYARDYNPNFKETDYYKVYNGLINDPRLLEAARRYGYRIQYVLHPIVSPQCEDFDKNDVVEIIPSIGDMSYEEIFRKGALMVTDFSGVQFDFAYMRKPVIYLHHNDIPQHYEEGTFHYDTMGFGEICHTNDELIDTLCRYMEQDCVMPEKYLKRADDFFEFSDHKNCERIYKVMLSH